jgi:ribosomal protein S18 acetylase RimI-like enzyme
MLRSRRTNEWRVACKEFNIEGRRIPSVLAQGPLSLEIREFGDSDYPRLAEVYEAIFPERARTIEEWRFYDDSLDKTKYYFKRYVCLNSATGVALGFAEMWNPPWMFHPKKFSLDGWVDPQYQDQGVGSLIYNRLKDDLDERGAIAAWMGIRENMTSSIAFAQKRGFNEKMRGWESTIDPYQVNTSEFQRYSTEASKEGIEFSTLEQELRQDPDCYTKLYEIVQTAFRDVPIPDTPTDTPYDQWLAFEMKNPNLIPRAYMIAKDGEKYVGTSVVWRLKKEPRSLYQGLTGVLREYRGRGIAMTLKLKVLDFARKNGFDNIRTFNASTNEGMLSINMKLGFKRDLAWITFEKNLE